MALNSLFCADVPLSNYSLTHAALAPPHSISWLTFQSDQNTSTGNNCQERV